MTENAISINIKPDAAEIIKARWMQITKLLSWL